ncbi:LD-carboxypeptidase [Candidatus Parcubacteria bacterium]|nr:LD-carboxypeptidase [Candidatus Parcubacteria bacterium]
MIPQKLKSGDEIRIIAPSRSLSLISKEVREIAIKKFDELGLKVSYSKNVEEIDDFMSSSIKSRIDDLHEAFSDKNVKGILTVIGGYNVNQILDYIDYDLIANNPKIICGFSDVTALFNAIYAKTGLVTYYGPHFSTLGMVQGIDYTVEYFKKCLFESDEFQIQSSIEWSDDTWFLDQEKREFIKNEGYSLINKGKAEGRIIGGNLCTFNLLQGTKYFPKLCDVILFIEDDNESNVLSFDRDLQSLIHQPDFSKVKGIVIGRFQKGSEMNNEKLLKIIKIKKELNNMPIIANADFGHTTPQFTFPIGGRVSLNANDEHINLKITEH